MEFEAEMEALEAESRSLMAHLHALQIGATASPEVVLLRGLRASVANLDDEIGALTEELEVVTLLNADVKHAAQAEQEGRQGICLKEIKNTMGALSRQADTIKSENVGLQAVIKRQRRTVNKVDGKEKVHLAAVSDIKAKISEARVEQHRLANVSNEEDRKFQAKLRQEQELSLQLNRKLRKARARANDVTSEFLLQRKVATHRAEWEQERVGLEDTATRLEEYLYKQEETLQANIESAQRTTLACETKLNTIGDSISMADRKITTFQGQAHQVREQLRDLGLFVSEAVEPSAHDVDEAKRAGVKDAAQATRMAEAAAAVAVSAEVDANPTLPPACDANPSAAKDDGLRDAEPTEAPPPPGKPRFTGRDSRYSEPSQE